MTTTTYTTVNGQILCQSKDGIVSHFVSDPLGSVVMVRDNSGNTVYEAEYDPYGNVQSETGTNPSEFGYVGTLGYVKDSAFSLYVRARYLLTNLGRWLTKDPLWPSEQGFVYAGASPSMWEDRYGLKPDKMGCHPSVPKTCPPRPLPKPKPDPMPGGFGFPKKGCSVNICYYTAPGKGLYGITHAFVCVSKPGGVCSGGINPLDGGWGDLGRSNCTSDFDLGVICIELETDCQVARRTCECLRATMASQSAHFGTYLGYGLCIGFAEAIISCGRRTSSKGSPTPPPAPGPIYTIPPRYD